MISRAPISITARAGALAIMVVAVVLSGCTIRREFIGNRLTQEDLEALPTLETKGEVLETIGPPSKIELRMDGSAFVYRYELQRGSGLAISAFQATFDNSTSDRRADLVIVYFDKQGRVERYGFARSGFSDEE